MKSKIQFLALVLLGIMLSINQVWADYTVTFNTASTDGTQVSTTVSNYVNSASTGYVSSMTSSKAYYNGVSGVKLGSSSATGNFVLTLSSTGKIKASKISITSATYDSNKTYKCTVTYSDNSTVNGTYTFGSSANLTLDETKTLKSVKFESVTANKGRGYISSFTVTAASTGSTYTVV